MQIKTFGHIRPLLAGKYDRFMGKRNMQTMRDDQSEEVLHLETRNQPIAESKLQSDEDANMKSPSFPEDQNPYMIDKNTTIKQNATIHQVTKSYNQGDNNQAPMLMQDSLASGGS